MQNPECNLSDINKIFHRRMINFVCASRFLKQYDKISLNNIKGVHKMIMHMEKHRNGNDILAGEFRKGAVFAGFTQFAPVDAIPRLVGDALHRYYDTDDNQCDPVLAAANLFVDLINIPPFEDGNGRICRLILSHVLMQSKCSLFPLMLSSFHR